MEEIISRARTAEAFLNVPNAGLSGSSLTELAELVEGNSAENTTGKTARYMYIRYLYTCVYIISIH